MRSLVAVARILSVLAHLLHGAWIIWRHFPALSQAQREARVQVWAQQMLARMAIDVQVSGMPPTSGPVLLASNHISWLDIIVIHASGHCRFISKSEIRGWPLVGMLASAAGTLYLERSSRRDAMRVVHQMAECLQQGDILAIFPEGTTGDGTTVLPFHANLLQAAIAASAPVQPVGLQFIDPVTQQISLAPCYIGDDTLVETLWRTLRTRSLRAVVRFGEAQQADGRDRRAWAADLQRAVVALRNPPELRG